MCSMAEFVLCVITVSSPCQVIDAVAFWLTVKVANEYLVGFWRIEKRQGYEPVDGEGFAAQSDCAVATAHHRLFKYLRMGNPTSPGFTDNAAVVGRIIARMPW